MKKYILDTNIISYLAEKTKSAQIIEYKLKSLTEKDQVQVSIITFYELIYGANSSKSNTQKKAFQQSIEFMKNYLEVIPLDLKEVEVFGVLKMKYKNYTGINKNSYQKT